MTYQSTVLADSPAYYWRFNETSGTSFADSAGTNTGTLVGGITLNQLAPPCDASSVKLDGSTGYITTALTVTPPTDISLEMWFNTTVAGGVLYTFGTGASTDDRHLYLNTSGQIEFDTWSGGDRYLATSATYIDGKWHHVVVTVTSMTNIVIYIDGVQVASKNFNISQEAPSAKWYIGYYGADTWNGISSQSAPRHFNGYLSNASIYPTILTATQVQNHYNAGIGGAPSGGPITLTASDNLTASDTASLKASKSLGASDTLTTTDSATMHTSTLLALTASDTTTTTDTASLKASKSLKASDTTTTTDTASLKASKALTASDTTTATDTASLKASKSLKASDTTTTTDSATMSVKISNVLSASDHATTTDTASLKVSKPLSAQDTTTIADTANLKASKSLSAHDTATATDSASLSSHTTLSANDTMSTSETAHPSKVIYLSASDSTSIGDSITLAVKRGLKGQDTAILVDSATMQMSKAMRAEDSEVINESAFLGVSVLLGLNPDRLTLTDSAELLVSSVAILNRLTIPGAWGITRQVSASWQTEETVGATWAIEATRKGSV